MKKGWKNFGLLIFAAAIIGMGLRLCVLSITDSYFSIITSIDGIAIMIAGGYIILKNLDGTRIFLERRRKNRGA